MKGLLAIYLILLLMFPGCMMAPMALMPLFTDKAQPQPPAQAQAESTGTPAKESGQRVDQQQRGEISGKP